MSRRRECPLWGYSAAPARDGSLVRHGALLGWRSVVTGSLKCRLHSWALVDDQVLSALCRRSEQAELLRILGRIRFLDLFDLAEQFRNLAHIVNHILPQ
jgi:hypothetical protein